MAEIQTSVDRRSLIDVYEINENGEEYVHSIIVNADQKWADFRQVIRPGTPLDRCYVIQHRLITGEVSEFSEMICHDGSYVINSNPRFDSDDDTGLNDIEDTESDAEEGNNVNEDTPPSRQGITFAVEEEGL